MQTPELVKRPGKVTREMMHAKIAEANVELRGAGVDESPHCYKRLNEVLAAHESSVKILHADSGGRGDGEGE
jgi:tRNA-splicing ligase RtcB (3'-phosphate/5'-hydroxy nucleic acid ligase)